MEEKPKAIYIDRHPYEWKNFEVIHEYIEREQKVIETLEKRFKVDFFYNIMNIDEEQVLKQKYSLMVTHLQDDPEKKEFNYDKSISRIQSIHRLSPELKIIVYTGAGIRAAADSKLEQSGISGVIRKRHINDLEKDMEELNKYLDLLFS
jgi:hypothetical protein